MPLEQVSEVRPRLVVSKSERYYSVKFADYRCSYCKNVSEKRVNNAKRVESCGCQRKRLHFEAVVKHGMIRTSTYRSWSDMIQRCSNPKVAQYRNYGGRGICVCERWLNSFEAFFADMGERPDGCSLDRIDNSRGYEPENCKWSTKSQQQRNTRQNRILTINGTSRCLSEWAEQPGAAKRAAIDGRLRLGWSHKEAVFGKST